MLAICFLALTRLFSSSDILISSWRGSFSIKNKNMFLKSNISQSFWRWYCGPELALHISYYSQFICTKQHSTSVSLSLNTGEYWNSLKFPQKWSQLDIQWINESIFAFVLGMMWIDNQFKQTVHYDVSRLITMQLIKWLIINYSINGSVASLLKTQTTLC